MKTLNRNNLRIIKKEENIIVNRFKCTQTKGEIHFCFVDGDVEDSEFHFYLGTEMVAVGKKDLLGFLKQLKLPDTTIEDLVSKIKNKYPPEAMEFRVNEAMNEFVDDNWENEFDSLEEAYAAQGRGEAETQALSDVITMENIELNTKLNTKKNT